MTTSFALKPFQAETVDKLAQAVRLAQAHAQVAHQTIVFAAPTGSGKTVMATTVIERILEGDESSAPDAEATFLWLSDQPDLNEQTRQKMLETSSVLKRHLEVVEADSFNHEVFPPGKVYFLNTQKLSKDANLVKKKGDRRDFTIWETITNTAKARPHKFFLIIDEAHRGMNRKPAQVRDAETILQKFVKGSPGEIPSLAMIIGISATPQRFQSMVSEAGRASTPITVPSEVVRESGLIKETIRVFHPDEKTPSDMTMLREAARKWQDYSYHWSTYQGAQPSEPLIEPILVVQVEDKDGRGPSATPLADAIDAVNEALDAPLPDAAFAHAFEDHTPLEVGGHKLRYISPPEIQKDPEVRVVFFKTSLNTGWDCPRAEVMMSFRKHQDATLIAQLVGRMVRTPLARRIDGDEFLNSTALYLPHYDKQGLETVVRKLTTPDPDTLPPIDVEEGDGIRCERSPDYEEVFVSLAALPSYVVPRSRKPSGVKRLKRLAFLLENDEIREDALEEASNALITVLDDAHDAVKETDEFKNVVQARGQVRVRAVDWQVGGGFGADATITLDMARENVDQLFDAAGRKLGEGLHKEWRKRRVQAGVPQAQAKLEAVALALRPEVLAKLEGTGQEKSTGWLKEDRSAINKLPEARQQTYNEVRALASKPEERQLHYPTAIEVRKADDLWDNHLYSTDGKFPCKLNNLETAVLRAEMAKPGFVAWLRNIDRKDWALTVPYKAGAAQEWKPLYPDFLIIREEKGALAVDILDPHMTALDDAHDKARGLCQFADQHEPRFGRIIIAMKDGAAVLSLDVNDESIREKVKLCQRKDALEACFRNHGTPVSS